MALTDQQRADMQSNMQQSVIACNDRCLYFAAKWLAELLNSFPSSQDPSYTDGSDTEIDEDNDDTTAPPSRSRDPREARREAKELSRYLLAKSLFDSREYDRCSAVFLPQEALRSSPAQHIASPSQVFPGTAKGQAFQQSSRRTHSLTSSPAARTALGNGNSLIPRNLSQKSLFLALYAKYLSGEKRKIEESETLLGPNDGAITSNPDVTTISAMLEEYFASRGGIHEMSNSQGWLDYLYGVVLAKSKSEALAKQWLLRSVALNPFNWSAWLELANLISSVEELQQVNQHLPRNVMAFFFSIHCSQQLLQNDASVHKTIDQIQAIFPRSAFLKQKKALLAYDAHNYGAALPLFEDLVKSDPYRLEGLETYSNLLYVLPNRPKLASLAALASDVDKFRPETNCILGNYYSIISEHEKAVLHFRRALTLDRTFHSAWTLMGHEYVELKNTQAAIESYRRAVDTNRKDFRAWYGLGQGYEMLECYSYSIFYYQRAAALCPHDPKMWAALGNAYSKCGKMTNAIQTYKRALVVGSQMELGHGFGPSDPDPLAHAVGGALDPKMLYEIALLYERQSLWDEAAAFMELTLAQEEGNEDGEGGLGPTQITSKARLWLARWSHTCGDYQRAMEYANELCQDAVEVEEAKALIKDVRSRLNLKDDDEEESMVSNG